MQSEKRDRMEERYAIFRRNFPFCVRAEESVRRLLRESMAIEERDRSGSLTGLVLIEENNILLLCVDEPYRRQGIGSRLLERAEAQIRAQGYDEITVGAGKHYLMPGVPVPVPPFDEKLMPDDVYPGLDSSAAEFFRRRGYFHSWDCNCFDMRMELKEAVFPAVKTTCRWAELSDLPGITACTDDAHEPFTKYYRRESLYLPGNDQRVLVAECDGRIAGTLIVSFETEGKGLGSVGCTAVHTAFQGRHIASDMVIEGTRLLQQAGLERAFLGYTYSGLDRLYGHAGYRICAYYFMAKKSLS